MAVHPIFFIVLVGMIAYANSAPAPFFFHHGKHHEHVIVHVPYKVHTIHHHHTEKVPVHIIKHVPVIKHIPIYKEVHVPVIKEVHVPIHVPEYKGWSSHTVHDDHHHDHQQHSSWW